MSKFFCVAALFYGSLVFGCEEGQLIRLRESGCQYAECRGGILVLIECKYKFLSGSGNHSCEHSGCSNSVRGCEEETFYSYYTDNRAYYHCESGRLVPKFCEKDEFFDSKEKMCRQISSVGKGQNDISINVPHNRRHKRDLETKCKDGTKRRKEGSCKQYYECKSETETLISCLECENYDETEKKCRYVFNTPCHHTAPIVEPGTTTCRAEVSPALPSGYSSNTDSPARDVPTTGEPATGAQYAASPTTVLQFTYVTTEVPHLADVSTAGPQFTDVSTEEPQYTVPPTTEAQNGGAESYQTPSPTQSTDKMTTSHPEHIHADCSQNPVRTALKSNCKSYLECQNGELVTRKCGWFEHFSSETNACAFSLLVRCD